MNEAMQSTPEQAGDTEWQGWKAEKTRVQTDSEDALHCSQQREHSDRCTVRAVGPCQHETLHVSRSGMCRCMQGRLIHSVPMLFLPVDQLLRTRM